MEVINNVQWGRMISDGRIIPGDSGIRGYEYARDDVKFDRKFGFESKLVWRTMASNWQVVQEDE